MGASFDPPDHNTGRRIAFGTSENTAVMEYGLLPTNRFRTYPQAPLSPTRPVRATSTWPKPR